MLPAPMNSAKVIKPRAIISLVRKLVIEGDQLTKKSDFRASFIVFGDYFSVEMIGNIVIHY